MFIVMCFGVLNKFVNMGMLWFLGFLNNSVGLLVCNVLLVIFVILRLVLMGWVMCINLFLVFSWWIKLCKFLYFISLGVFINLIYGKNILFSVKVWLVSVVFIWLNVL